MSSKTALAAAALWLFVGGMLMAAEAAVPDVTILATAEIESLTLSACDAAALHLESDDHIKAAVTHALESDPALAGSAIRVLSVDRGTVVLVGEVGPFTNQLRAIATASRVPGVRVVLAQVRGAAVEAAMEVERDDEVARVDQVAERARLGLDDRASHREQPRPEPVRLDPRIAAAADKVEEFMTGAVAAAGSRVVGATRDAWITAATKAALLAHPDVPALDVDVDAADGIVTLFGIVPSRSAKDAAAESASAIAGVRAVDNALEVVPPATRERVAAQDEEVRTHLSRVLAASGLLEHEDISVDVKNGVARLTGEVSDDLERAVASSMVRATPGVRAVNNDLRIAAN